MSDHDRLVDLFLQATPDARSDLVAAYREHLTLPCLEAFKARADGLLYQEPRRSLEIAEVTLWVASCISDPLAHAVARWARGNALTFLGRYEEALADYEEALADYEQAHALYARQQTVEPLPVARLQSNMVAVLKELGRYQEAIAMAALARRSLEPLGPTVYLAALEMNVGSICRLQGHYSDALDAYERGSRALQALDNRVQAARMDINRARVLVCMDRFDQAEPLLQAAHQVLSQEGQALPAARAQLNMATLHSRQGHHIQALQMYDRARTSFAALGADVDVAVADLYSTHDYLALNLLSEAAELAGRAHDTLQGHQMPRYVALAASNRGAAARKQGDLAHAIQDLTTAGAALAALGAAVEAALVDVERAGCLCEHGEWMEAAAVAQQAIDVLSAHHLELYVARARLVLAQAMHRSGDPGSGKQLYAQALGVLKEIPTLAWQAHDGLGQVAETEGQLRQAYTHYQHAIGCLETAEERLGLDEFRAGFIHDKLPVYQRAVRLALSLGDQEQAFDYAERSKNGVWRDVLLEDKPQNAGEQLTILRYKWHWLYSQLMRPDEEDGLRGGEIESRWAELHALELELARARREVGQPVGRHDTPALALVQQRLADRTLLLDYYCTDQAVSVFLIARSGVTAIDDLAPIADLDPLIQRWRFNLESVRLLSSAPDLLAEAREILHDLYRLLIEPLAPHLQASETLWIAPHDLLWMVPFDALWDGNRHLVERFTITHLPGILMTGLESDAYSLESDVYGGTSFKTPLVVGCSEKGQLSHAAQEAQDVCRLLEHAHLLLEAEATLARVREQSASCSLLHLATHGVFRTDAPLFSALHLADGWLTAHELEDWTLSRTALVTLSACETGMSARWGSDLLGLMRGFCRAGARRLVTSQWAVDDASTAELMALFYRWLGAGQPIAVALRTAQAAMRVRYEHPFYWAGFQFVELV